jgi:hypothetical protein
LIRRSTMTRIHEKATLNRNQSNFKGVFSVGDCGTRASASRSSLRTKQHSHVSPFLEIPRVLMSVTIGNESGFFHIEDAEKIESVDFYSSRNGKLQFYVSTSLLKREQRK